MKKIFVIALLALAACKKDIPSTPAETDSTIVDTSNLPLPVEDTTGNIDNEAIAPERTTANPDESVTGNFTGKQLTAMATLVHKGEGAPVDGGTPSSYSITFSDPNISAIPAGCCEILLLNEGDLNGDGLDELGFAQAPMNGCTFTYHVYTFKNGKWKEAIEPFLIPTGCDGITRNDLQKRVFNEGGEIYTLLTDMNDENMKQVKTKAKILLK